MPQVPYILFRQAEPQCLWESYYSNLFERSFLYIFHSCSTWVYSIEIKRSDAKVEI